MVIRAEGKGGVDISGRFERRVGLDWGVETVELGIKGLGRVEASTCGDGTVVGTGVDGVETVELGIKGLGRVEASTCGDGTVVGTGVDGVWLGGGWDWVVTGIGAGLFVLTDNFALLLR